MILLSNQRHILDVQYFDSAFTIEKPQLTPVDKDILASMDQTQFRDFSYTNPNTTDWFAFRNKQYSTSSNGLLVWTSNNLLSSTLCSSCKGKLIWESQMEFEKRLLASSFLKIRKFPSRCLTSAPNEPSPPSPLDFLQLILKMKKIKIRHCSCARVLFWLKTAQIWPVFFFF